MDCGKEELIAILFYPTLAQSAGGYYIDQLRRTLRLKVLTQLCPREGIRQNMQERL